MHEKGENNVQRVYIVTNLNFFAFSGERRQAGGECLAKTKYGRSVKKTKTSNFFFFFFLGGGCSLERRKK